MTQLNLLPTPPSDPPDTLAATERLLQELTEGGLNTNPYRMSFGAMGVAEDAIEEAMRGHPGNAELINAAFAVLCPRWDVFQGRANERNLRAHMDELLRRVAQDGRDADVETGTAMEGAIALLEFSLRAPPKHRYYIATVALFTDALGEQVAEQMVGAETVRRAKEDRNEQVIAEIIDDVRRKTGDRDRKKAWHEKLARVGL